MRTLVTILCVFLLHGLIYSPDVYSGQVLLTAEERQWLAEHPVIQLAPSPAFASIESVNNKGEYVGIAADYVALLGKKVNIKFSIIAYPSWNQVLEQTRQKKVDVLAAVAPSTQHEAYLNFTTPHIKLPGMIILNDRASGSVTVDDLKNMRVASLSAYSWFDLLGYDRPEIKLREAKSLKAGLRDLSTGVLDAVVADPVTAAQVIKEEALKNLRIGGETGYSFDLAFAVRKDWPILHNILEKSVQAISHEEHQTILDKWIQHKGEKSDSTMLQIGLAVGVTLLIALVLGFVLINMLSRVRVAKQTQALNEANARLSATNVELEQRVVEHKNELENALSDLNLSQVKMVQSEKLATLGQMIAGIAHEINTPLGYAHSNLATLKNFITKVKKADTSFNHWKKLLEDGFSSEDEISKKFVEVGRAFESLNAENGIEKCDELAVDTLYGLDQISDITHNLKDFSRMKQVETAEVDLNDNVERMLKLAKNLLKNRISVDLSLGQLPLIKCNSTKINQVLLNLITNACHAIEDSGKEKGIVKIVTAFDGDLVHISVKDNGIGIPADVGKKMFDPFYTTKGIGQGTGLGLSISYNIIVKEHKGKISVKTREGLGTKFVISLPAEVIEVRPVGSEVLPEVEVTIG